ncbi:acyltransferase family protein [Streptomyces hokutonensis]|uniref:acyltransferase family protein n=1 Tax=Streptomyces hokutonensis TaxID=1306990 RepID=UPI0036A092B5
MGRPCEQPAATPALHAAHRRWGLRVPVVLGAVALVADTLVVTVHAPVVGLLNYVLVWGVAYQLGFCWRDKLLTERSAVSAFMAAGGAVAFAALVRLGPFPVSLILVTGQSPSNTNPPSAAMLAWAVGQVGVALLLAPALRRLLERGQLWQLVRPLGGAGMTLYLWHMLPVLVVAGVFYLPDLAPEPAYGSGSWWALRVPWLAVLTVVLVGVVGGAGAVGAWAGSGLRADAAGRRTAQGLGVVGRAGGECECADLVRGAWVRLWRAVSGASLGGAGGWGGAGHGDGAECGGPGCARQRLRGLCCLAGAGALWLVAPTRRSRISIQPRAPWELPWPASRGRAPQGVVCPAPRG